MRVRAALLDESPGTWQVREVELDGPAPGEVLVRMAAAGLCHSDAHFMTGDIPPAAFPFCGGHEGAGVVEEIGAGVTEFAVGDHVVTSFIPACGRCRWCASGRQNLCDNGAILMAGTQLDGTFRMHDGGKDVGRTCCLGTFAQAATVPEISLVKIAPDVPLAVAALVGCGVPTGFGSAVHAARVQPGDVVIVMGVGGVGMNAVQGAAIAGARRVIAADPVAMKRDAAPTFGATDAVATIDEAAELARQLTNGQGADATIVTIGVITPEHTGPAVASIRKGGTLVLTSTGRYDAAGVQANLVELAMYEKRVQGSLYGMSQPRRDVPLLLDLWREGKLKLEELTSSTYKLDEINQGYADLDAGRNLRGLLVY